MLKKKELILRMNNFYKDKKVLVTGHTGFKGTWLCALLNYLNADVYGYALKAEDNSLYNQAHMDEHVKSYIGDIRDYDYLNRVINEVKPEIVIHMAAQPIVKKGYEDPVYTYGVNVMGTVNLLDCIKNCDSVKSVINVTTDKVYQSDYSKAYKEEDVLNGYDPYSNSKSCSELVSNTYYNCFLKDKGVALSTLRAGNVIGGGDFSDYRIMSDCMRAYLNKDNIIIRNPDSIRPYQHVLEALYMYLHIAKKQYEDNSLSDAYNIGPDKDDYVNTLELVKLFVDKINNKTGGNMQYIIQNDNGPLEAETLMLDNTKTKRIFNYKPRWYLDEAVEEICDYLSNYENSNDIYSYLLSTFDKFLI